jgi:hypothetical protein
MLSLGVAAQAQGSQLIEFQGGRRSQRLGSARPGETAGRGEGSVRV